LPTADFDAAVDGIFRSAFLNTGQVCLGTERVYVERPIFERFVHALKAKVEAVKYGRPEDHADQLRPADQPGAPPEGAVLLPQGGGGGRHRGDRRRRARHARPSWPEGAWVQPTIWTGLPETQRWCSEEIFGPCCHIRPFDSENEVVALANDTDYGLSTTIWTTNLARAHRVAGAYRGGHHLDQQLVPARPAHGLRRLEAVGHRPRGRRAFAGVLHRDPERLREAVIGADRRRPWHEDTREELYDAWPTVRRRAL
jgi:acyl-CoA reductase-like NAD-dependent aldehyde dehydrogenase